MDDFFMDLPFRIKPYILLDYLSQRVPITSGSFRLIGETDGSVEGELVFRWHPSPAVEFEGIYDHSNLNIESSWFLESSGKDAFSVPILITEVVRYGYGEGRSVRGITQKPLSIGDGSFDVLRFCLSNFPDYFGLPFRECSGTSGMTKGRLQIGSEWGECRLDKIPEAKELVKRANRDAGYVISHVGEWVPSSGSMTVQDAEEVLLMLHFWFGLLRGAWAGPLFPQGVSKGNVVWRQFASRPLGESYKVLTWLPQRRQLDLSAAFRGFVNRWNDTAWKVPLRSAISWFVEANSSRTATEPKIILAQVALELLAWVHIVETQQLHSRSDFNRLSAAGRIRVLLQHIDVPADIPPYFKQLPALQTVDAFDGPGVITTVRNACVHEGEKNRNKTRGINGEQLWECSQLALHYVELAFLAVCHHDSHYAQRGFCGWKGDDEILVPWAQKH